MPYIQYVSHTIHIHTNPIHKANITRHDTQHYTTQQQNRNRDRNRDIDIETKRNVPDVYYLKIYGEW